MAQLNPYIRFDGNAREAFTFYKECLGGELSFQTVGESPMGEHMSDKKDDIFHAQLKNGKVVLLGSDMVGEEGLKKGNSMVLTLTCDSSKEAKTSFAKLSEGGKVGHPLSEADFGTIGDFTDKYGIDWFIVFMGNPKA